jgi:SAM-dependent methyltransferase
VLQTVKTIARRVPALGNVYRYAREAYANYLRRRYPSQDIFRDKNARNAWRSAESVSGTGSDLTQTRVIAEALPALLRDLRASSLLDVPCGDFHWMRLVDLNGINYVGGDVVKEIVARNRQYERPGVAFRHLNLLTGPLPRADVVFCRDCLVHFSHADVQRALENICRTQATWLVTTTFTARSENPDIPTGRWRPLNLELAPFSLPTPDRVIVEQCTEGGGRYRDKSLGVWRIDDIRRRYEG